MVIDSVDKNIHVGLLTTYNQPCGLAAYARYLKDELTGVKVTVLAEQISATLQISKDDADVIRCWSRDSSQYDELRRTIAEQRINILHLNCQHKFFIYPEFTELLKELRKGGVGIIAHVHNSYTLDPQLEALVTQAHRVIVHTPENKLEVIASGALPDRVDVVEQGIKILPPCDRATLRSELGIPADQTVLVCFGFVQAHKGIDEVIQAVAELRTALPKLKLFVVGGPHHEDPTSAQYHHALKQMVAQNNIENQVSFIEGYVEEDVVSRYLQAADAVVMNYRSQHYESSAAIARAFGAGVPIIASLAPAFSRLGDAVFHVTSGYPMPLAIYLVTKDAKLNNVLREQARVFAAKNSWKNIGRIVRNIYRTLFESLSRSTDTAKQISDVEVTTGGKRSMSMRTPLRILMQNRSNAYTHRGGDTVVMDRVAAELRTMGVHVDIDLDGTKSISEYDLVHLHNFATPEITEAQARRVKDAGKHYVVTTMYEDLPRFYNQMFAFYHAVQVYMEHGQQKEIWPTLLEASKNCQPSGRWENSWTAANALTLICTGEAERQALLRDYPDAAQVEIYRCGCDIEAIASSPEVFQKEFGLQDFILCVGRLETRKNQLALLKALEDSDSTVVFATGGFTYQPEYEEFCRNFKRRGKTVFLGRLSHEMLASAYAAARVHALPSWYELPGISSLEAARSGCAVVTSEYGTTRDYFGDKGFYCDPASPESIYKAIMAAFYYPKRDSVKEQVASFTWKNAAARILQIYEQALGVVHRGGRATYQLPEWRQEARGELVEQSIEHASEKAQEARVRVAEIAHALSPTATINAHERALALCAQADGLVREGAYDEAENIYARAIALAPEEARAYRGCGVIALEKKQFEEAEVFFKNALKYAKDAKGLTGLATSLWSRGMHSEAFSLYQEASALDPANASIVFYLMNAAYTLGKYAELEVALRQHLAVTTANAKMLYCLAGCVYKQGRLDDALVIVEETLQNDPSSAEALELRDVIESKQSSAAIESRPSVSVTANDPVGRKLQELEVLNAEKEFEEVIARAASIISDGVAREDQISLARLLRAEALCRIDRLDEAEKEFLEVEASGSYRSRAAVGRGVVCGAREDWTSAQQHFTAAIQLTPKNDIALAGLGICAMKNGQMETAWTYFKQALAVDCENMRALLGIIQVGYPLRKLAEVQASLEEFLVLHPAHLAILYSYAGCLYAQGLIAQAKAALNKILIFDSQHALAKELLDKIAADEGMSQNAGA